MAEDSVMKEEEEGEESEEEVESEEEEEEDETDSEFDDPEGYVDNITDEELLGDLLKQKPKEEEGVDKIIVVDNAPKVGPDRMQKLQNVLEKVFGRFGTIVRRYYPVDENTKMFKGYFFLEFSTREEAEAAVTTGNGYRLDKAHVFATNFFSDFETYRNLPEKWEPPQKTEFVNRGNLRSWLLNKSCFDQFSVIFSGGDNVAICENTGKEQRIVTERKNWTDTYVRWSPHGTYLATLHRQGVALWGGPEFERYARFSHNGVQLIDFSPCERYLVTFSAIVDDPNSPQNIIVWEICTGKKKRSFLRGNAEDWPILKWNRDGEYFARMTENLISIYKTPSFGLLDKKSIVVKEVKDISWCPTENQLAYWVPETTDIPAKITVLQIPSRTVLSTKSKMLVKECKLHWHKGGDYLCVRVDHYLTKTRKQLCSSFEIFHMREPQIPVDTIELKEPIHNFALEPKGSKFAIIHGEPPIRVCASFYKINDKGAAITKLKTLERREANHIFWCPNGQFVVLAGMKSSMNNMLEFIDTADMTSMNSVEHTGVTDVEWDPTGRYVTSAVSYWTQKMDTGFIMWSFQGNVLYRNPIQIEKFCQLLWRPRPPTLLTKEDQQTIRRDMKKYQIMFEQEDRSTRSKASKELMEKRNKLMTAFNDYRKKREELMRDRRQQFMEAIPAQEEGFEEQVTTIFLTETVVAI